MKKLSSLVIRIILTEQEINEILRTLEKEHIDLIMQDELEGEAASLDGLEDEAEGARLDVKTKLESSLDLQADQFDEDEAEEERKKKKKRPSVKWAALKLLIRSNAICAILVKSLF